MNTTKKISFMWIWTILLYAANVFVVVFKPGGETTMNILGNFFSIFSALTASASLLLVFSNLKVFDETKTAWLLLFIGQFLYFAGDVVFASYEVGMDVATPFPSLADVFYFSGYVLYYSGLIYIINGFKRSGLEPVGWKRYVVIGLLWAFMILVVTKLLFIPIIQSSDISFTEKFLDLAYPLCDTGLIILMFIILRYTTTLGKGMFSKPWQFIIVGFIFTSIGDILFSYNTFNETYKSATFVDLWLNTGYLLIAIGGYIQAKIIEKL
jgi:hypothetical protein